MFLTKLTKYFKKLLNGFSLNKFILLARGEFGVGVCKIDLSTFRSLQLSGHIYIRQFKDWKIKIGPDCGP